MTVELFSFLLFLLAIAVVIFNWFCVLSSLHNLRQSIDKYHSTIPLAAQILLGLAALLPKEIEPKWIPAYAYWIIFIIDVALWQLAYRLSTLAFKDIE